MNDDHHHCKVCGKVCSPDAEVCGSNCRERRERGRDSRRNTTYLLYGMIALMVVLFLLNTFGL
jgi:predicted nucleic acid-binding Zn ribbon protein